MGHSHLLDLTRRQGAGVRCLLALPCAVSVTALGAALAVGVAAPARAQAGLPAGMAAATTALSNGFANEVASLGLIPTGEPRVVDLGDGAFIVTMSATVPFSERPTPTFLRRQMLSVGVQAGGSTVFAGENDLTGSDADGHVTLTTLVSFPGSAAGAPPTQVRRTITFDSDEFAALVASMPPAELADRLEEAVQAQRATYRNYTDTLTVTSPDGSSRTVNAEAFLAAPRAGKDLPTCLSDCFNASGGDLTLFESVCIATGIVGCGAVCAVTVGVGCFPCIGTVAGVCGVVGITGNLSLCMVQCAFPNAVTPTPRPTSTVVPRTRTPTRTPTPPLCVGDCNDDGAVTIDELVLGVTIALGTHPPSACFAFDTDGDGMVTIDELIAAVRAALDGCVRPAPVPQQK